MSFLKNLTSDDSIANERDSVGGGGVLDSGLYPATVSMAYVTTSEGGAIGLVFHAKTAESKEIRQTFWMTSGTAKGCKNYYEKDGEKHYLPGYIMANALCLLTVGKEISELEPEEKVVKAWNKEAKAEVPTKVQMLTDLLNQPILIGLIKQTVDKTAKGDDGKYYATGETRDENEVDKFFRASDRKTTAEIRAQAEEATFVDTWSGKWTGQVKNKAGKTPAMSGTAGMPTKNSAASSKPKQSLFA